MLLADMLFDDARRKAPMTMGTFGAAPAHLPLFVLGRVLDRSTSQIAGGHEERQPASFLPSDRDVEHAIAACDLADHDCTAFPRASLRATSSSARSKS